MSLVFDRQNRADFKALTTANKRITIKGVNSTVTSADTITSGVTGLLYVAGLDNTFVAVGSSRSLTEVVAVDE